MGFKLEREKTTSTPYILVDEDNNYMKLAGRSFQDGVVEVFVPIVEWLDTYLKSNFDTFTFDCSMDYFNSSTVKILSTIIKKLDAYADAFCYPSARKDKNGQYCQQAHTVQNSYSGSIQKITSAKSAQNKAALYRLP